MTQEIDSIPPITDPLGQYWHQPPTSEILLDGTHALMAKDTFKRLHEYSSTTPTGVYPGKMWKSQMQGKWWLVWFGHDPDPNFCSNHYREILLA